MAFNVVFMSLFAMLPAPIVYGAIIDNTCILWQSECGATTNCIVYSTVALRQVLMFTTAGIMFFGVILDIGSWYYSKVRDIYRVFHQLADLGWADLDLGCSSILPSCSLLSHFC